MYKATLLVLVAMILQDPATAPTVDADALAREVMNASGAEVWPNVVRIRFTFNVHRDGKQLALVKHDWDLRAGTDTVSWKDKKATVDVRSSQHQDEIQTEAYARFINDSYWLLAPLKLMDPGVARSTGQSQEIDGKTYRLLHLRFDEVGLTPGDQYDLWIDPQTKLVQYWDYIPAPGMSSRFTWEDYRDFNGLKLATKHVSPRGDITFTDIEVTLK